MRIPTFLHDGTPTPEATLTKDASGSLYLDGKAVLAVAQWGRLVALTLVDRLVLIRVADYARLVPYCNMISMRYGHD